MDLISESINNTNINFNLVQNKRNRLFTLFTLITLIILSYTLYEQSAANNNFLQSKSRHLLETNKTLGK
jgi:hypothetical protein